MPPGGRKIRKDLSRESHCGCEHCIQCFVEYQWENRRFVNSFGQVNSIYRTRVITVRNFKTLCQIKPDIRSYSESVKRSRISDLSGNFLYFRRTD